MFPKFALSLIFLAFVINFTTARTKPTTTTTTTEKATYKRSLDTSFISDAALLGGSGGGSSGGAAAAFNGPWAITGARFSNSLGPISAKGWNPWSSYSNQLNSSPSPAEVSNAIAAAKQASANVLIAQQQMQAAKENVLNQQRIAMEKETAAALLTQKSEAAAAIQRSEAAAAAQAVVLAQQRLAASKSAVAHQQRIAAAREAEAASALQRSAHAAAAEIQKTEYEASKLSQYTRNGNAGAAHHLTLTKDTAFSPITAGTNHVPNLESFGGPWSSAATVPKGAASAAGWL